jgi:hypothetical protein
LARYFELIDSFQFVHRTPRTIGRAIRCSEHLASSHGLRF